MNSREILGKLIAFNTVSDLPNALLIDWMASYLKELGAAVEVIPGEEGKACLWARLGPDVPGGVVLAGHTDVVPVAGQNWSHNPFDMIERDGKLHGRGACDMKGFIACALGLAERLQNTKLQKPIYLALTHDEEKSMNGAKNLVRWIKEKGIKPDWVWLGEPTEMKVAYTHKGTTEIIAHITGVAAHSSVPDHGLNAIYLTSEIVSWVRGRAEAGAQRPVAGSPFDPPYTTFSVGIISGGKATNIVADHCMIDWQYRLHPGDDEDVIMADYERMLDERVRPLIARYPGAALKMERNFYLPPFATKRTPEIEALLLRLTDNEELIAVPYGTEASFYQEMGAPVYICGPGSVKQAHQPDEYIELDQMNAIDSAFDALAQSLS